MACPEGIENRAAGQDWRGFPNFSDRAYRHGYRWIFRLVCRAKCTPTRFPNPNKVGPTTVPFGVPRAIVLSHKVLDGDFTLHRAFTGSVLTLTA